MATLDWLLSVGALTSISFADEVEVSCMGHGPSRSTKATGSACWEMAHSNQAGTCQAARFEEGKITKVVVKPVPAYASVFSIFCMPSLQSLPVLLHPDNVETEELVLECARAYNLTAYVKDLEMRQKERRRAAVALAALRRRHKEGLERMASILVFLFCSLYIVAIFILVALDGPAAASGAACLFSKVQPLAWLAEPTCSMPTAPGLKSTIALCMVLIAAAWFHFFIGPEALYWKAVTVIVRVCNGQPSDPSGSDPSLPHND